MDSVFYTLHIKAIFLSSFTLVTFFIKLFKFKTPLPFIDKHIAQIVRSNLSLKKVYGLRKKISMVSNFLSDKCAFYRPEWNRP